MKILRISNTNLGMFINIPNSQFDDVKVTWLAARSFMSPIFQEIKNEAQISFTNYLPQMKNELIKKGNDLKVESKSIKDEIHEIQNQAIPHYI